MNNFELQQKLLGQNESVRMSSESANPLVQYLEAHRVEMVAVLACLALLSLVFELVRRHQIKEKYSFLWFATGSSLLVLTLKRDWLDVLAKALGVYYPPTALFLVLSFFMIVILVHFSMVLSKLITQNQKLAQKIALLEAGIESKIELKFEKEKQQIVTSNGNVA